LRIKEAVICILVILLPANNVDAQSRHVRKVISKQEKKAEQEDEDYQKRRKDVLKHRHDIQTKDVQERMKLSEKKSRLYNKSKEEPFLSNLFSKKRRKYR
jgi:hypothetical protein